MFNTGSLGILMFLSIAFHSVIPLKGHSDLCVLRPFLD